MTRRAERKHRLGFTQGASAPSSSVPQPSNDPVASAQSVGLRYVSDEMPGIRRRRAGRSFVYLYPTGAVVRDRVVLDRIHALAVPPAWSNVWICPDPAGHLQATGRDERGRKQSRYHRRWREVRDDTKYARMLAFARALTKIRRQVQRDLALPGLPREKVLAGVVRLLEVSLIRVGNDKYARENESFGLTTLRRRHADVNGATVRFHFRGKAGKWHEIDVRDRRLARIVQRCQDLPGQPLFQYLGENGSAQDIHSEDVNEYLRQVTGEDFTAKDFRTWAGTVLAAVALQEFKKCDSKAQAKKNVVRAIESVASRLGNTVAVCRKCYVHPEVLSAYLEGSLLQTLKSRVRERLCESLPELSSEEAAVVAFLERRLAAAPGELTTQLKASLKAQTARPKSQT